MTLTSDKSDQELRQKLMKLSETKRFFAMCIGPLILREQYISVDVIIILLWFGQGCMECHRPL